MKKWLTSILPALAVAMTALSASGMPFSSDMVGGQLITGTVMRPKAVDSIPVGSLDRQLVSQDEALKLQSPVVKEPGAASAGQKLFAVNCQLCHGKLTSGQHEFSQLLLKGMPSINLADPSIAAKPDGHFFGYVYLGGALMPPYGWKLSNDEMWQVVAYIRQQQAAASVQGSK